MKYMINTARPIVLSGDFLIRVRDMVLAGGAVQQESLFTRIQGADRLYWLEDHGALIAVAALKNPVQRYREQVFASIKTVLPAGAQAAPHEFGWLCVHNDFRGAGLARQLTEYVCRNHPECFAITRHSDVWMHKIMPAGGMQVWARFEMNGREFEFWY